MADQGRVISISMSATGGIPKYTQESIAVGAEGVEGDHHAGPINKHKKTGDPEPNHRQVTVVSEEVVQDLNARLGIDIKPGDLAENVLVGGLGDLTQFEAGDRLELGGDVVLEVTGHNRPCDLIRKYHPDLVEEIAGKRGLATVVAATGTVRVGDACIAIKGESTSD
ncbi:MAG: sulfurase [Chloroflexi bacterium]|jgi:MOSC domain-containing protein YiiM|nr:sulfurase [Chloroflexota bacterium]MDP6419877.1 MOSC domain-containing protein [SAR202 cluster bacterium]HAL49673.1 sulfurase [Dehalococcoidia bacterium]MDP6664171.1 MOSC domain-containing protein [SAR202 cluster bacterium]MDP6800335.1 MOSC domain-containing protein [SAR202 cluster bacterium]|tara:strand:- start:3825 stop:4325 length:501 start_codon:yes stop_codon:yes gene_type:complete